MQCPKMDSCHRVKRFVTNRHFLCLEIVSLGNLKKKISNFKRKSFGKFYHMPKFSSIIKEASHWISISLVMWHYCVVTESKTIMTENESLKRFFSTSRGHFGDFGTSKKLEKIWNYQYSLKLCFCVWQSYTITNA